MSETRSDEIRLMTVEPAGFNPTGYTRELGLRVLCSGLAYEVWTSATEIVVIGAPSHDDEGHNCDEMGCGQEHVLVRIREEGKHGTGR